MKLHTEIVEERQNALIVSKKGYLFITLLKNELKRVSINPFNSPLMPKNLKIFQFIFLVNEPISLEKVNKNKKNLFLYIFFEKKYRLPETKKYPGNYFKKKLNLTSLSEHILPNVLDRMTL